MKQKLKLWFSINKTRRLWECSLVKWYHVTSSHIILSLKDAKWKLSKYKNLRSAEEWEATVTEGEMKKDTPQLKTEAQDLSSSAAMGKVCVRDQKGARHFQIYGSLRW